jgi:hypothetical protein
VGPFLNNQLRTLGAFIISSALLITTGCGLAPKTVAADEVAAIASYCSSPTTYNGGATINGTAKYEYRIEGNGVIADGNNAFKPSTTTPSLFSLRILVTGPNSYSVQTTKSWNCLANCTASKVIDGLTNAINDNMTGVDYVKATGDRILGLSTYSGYTITVDQLSGLTALDTNPIRYAEVKIFDSSGTSVQCGETDGFGDFVLDVPDANATYTVRVYTRANNTHNTAYIMNTPTSNTAYSISASVSPSVSTNVDLIAPATGTLLGGAFNIMDQIQNAQDYLRTTTAGCDSVFSECIPVTTVPLVYVYWRKGISPGVYYGMSGPISFYLNGDRQLYILGGVGGDSDVEDMDHFDNSVITHEYGHFIEDQFGAPDSPGGSHDGDSIIDPRLAWGEGWADFFQAAVRNDPYYRDTVGHVCDLNPCSSSQTTLAAFDEYLDPSGGTYKDTPAILGEGNFREFSVTRALWDIVKTSGISQFSEIWTALNGTDSMRTVTDYFKSIGRLYYQQASATGHTDWSSTATNEKQQPSMIDYGNPLLVQAGCAPASKAMAIKKVVGDEGSPDTADQFRNNDFYLYTHPGGPLTILLTWSGGAVADLDLYLYKRDYAYGTSTGRLGYSYAESHTTSGTESISRTLEAGVYLINVVGFTGEPSYSNNSTYSTTYQLKIGGVTACPTL